MKLAKDGRVIQNFGVQSLSITVSMRYGQAVGAEIPLENQPRLLRASIKSHPRITDAPNDIDADTLKCLV